MNNEQTPAANAGNTTPNTEEHKTFSQEDLNRIVGERLAREKTKFESDFAEREKALTQRELTLKAKERLTASGLSPELLEAINISDAAAFEKSLSIIEKHLPKQQTAPIELIGATPGKPSSDTLNGIGELTRKAMGLT